MNKQITSTLLCLMIAVPAWSGPDYSATLSEETYSFSQPFGTALVSFSEISARLPLPNYSYDFGAADDTTFTITAQAPVGQMIVVSPPIGFGSPSDLKFYATTDSRDSDASSFLTSASIQSPFGPPLVDKLDGSGVSLSPNVVQTSADLSGLTPGETYYFTSISVTVEAPASFDTNIDLGFSQYRIAGSVLDRSGTMPDPGPWITLQAIPVPEPTTFVLGLAGLSGLLVARQRRG